MKHQGPNTGKYAEEESSEIYVQEEEMSVLALI